MNLKKKVSLLMLTVLILSLGLVGCSNEESADSQTKNNDNTSSDEEVTIEFWHTYSDTEAQIFNDEVMPLFNEKYPNIHVKVTRMPFEGLKQQVIAGVSGDAAPDVMRMDLIWVPEFAKLGALKKLGGFEGFEDIKGNVFEGSMSTNIYNNEYYGLPLNTNTKVAIYNKELLEKAGLSSPPKTFDELIAASKKLKSSETFGIGIGGTGSWTMLPYFWSFGGSITNDEYTKADGYLNSEESIAALQKIVDLNKQGLIAPTILGGEPGSWDGMKAGNYLMIDDGPWFYSLLGEEGLEKTVPATFPEGKAGSFSVVGGENVVMFNTTDHEDASWKFMQFLMSEESQLKMAQTGLIPTLESAANSDEVLKVPFIKPYIEQSKTAKPRTPHPNWGKIEESLNLAFEIVIRGESSVEDALNQAAQEIDGMLQ
ncbi:extracellular solute-binding protein [Bacillaceae bacterium S4-13-58]